MNGWVLILTLIGVCYTAVGVTKFVLWLDHPKRK